MIDLVKPGKPDFLLMTRRTRRGISAYARSLTSPVQFESAGFGQRVMFYDGIPVLESDFMVDTETISSGGVLGQDRRRLEQRVRRARSARAAGAGLTNGGIQVEEVGALETKDARRWRCKWYVCAGAVLDAGAGAPRRRLIGGRGGVTPQRRLPPGASFARGAPLLISSR